MMHNQALAHEEKKILLQVAEQAIEQAFIAGKPILLDVSEYPLNLRAQRATFVTLKIDGLLRGCIGTLEAVRPLAMDVYYNAYAAAFTDPRFPPLERKELGQLNLSLSLLSTLEPMHCSSKEKLIDRLQPGIDGLLIEADHLHRSTFLPVVWEDLPDPEVFLRQLWRKAGLAPDYWSDSLCIYRYTTEIIDQ